MKNWWKDFIAFRRFVTPEIMPVVFWVGVAIAVIMGIITIVEGARSAFGGARLVTLGIVTLFCGPVFVRILCELVLTFFKRQ
ncbi:TPA: hypothetical protein DCL37_08000 [Candidatus Acetothermia bacterium]|nr:DUF4282 domain-containing protein [Candidatus Bipolaricaulota bacterium]HAF71263.1 hypothetical protein [Candidatus Acetothermia bacterium]